MAVHELAGKPAPRSLLVNVPRLVSSYYTLEPDPENPAEAVSFGTSGHRGSSLRKSFNEAHILATTQAICEFRKGKGIDGPLYMGMDTHALSEPSFASALEVLAANGVETLIQDGLDVTPTPVISHAILAYNRGRSTGLADGIVITPSHNPPADGGFKYDPPTGGPADTDSTRWIEDRANRILLGRNAEVRRMPYEKALRASTTHRYDYIAPYVADLATILDMESIRASGVHLGVDPLGGSSVPFWGPIAERYGLNLDVVNPVIDPTFAFMTVDHDGKIRMDCSSPYAMASLIGLKDKYDVAFGNDPDSDRHGIVTRVSGLMNPNHYLAVAIWYLFGNRPGWRKDAAVGKTLVSSAIIDRISAHLGRRLAEVPVGFKWFVEGLIDGSYGFAGEESAGAAFLRKDGSVWTTDKDGIIMDLLAAEILARTGKDPGEHYRELTERFGAPIYERIDTPITPELKAFLTKMTPEQVTATTLAGSPICCVMTRAPENGASMGGIKVVSDDGWFAARPSGTEAIYKLYTESFLGPEHLLKIQEEARAIIAGR